MLSATTEVTDKGETLVLDLHKKYRQEIKPSSLFQELNESAIERFEFLKFPDSKHEMYTFASTKELARTRFDLQRKSAVGEDFIKKHVYAGSNVITLIDGVYRHDLSNITGLDSRVSVTGFDKAVADPAIKRYLLDTIDEENDVFASINGAFLHQGVLVEVEPLAPIEAPLQILHVSSGSASNPVMTTPRVLIKIGRHAEVKLIVKYVGVAGNYFVNAVQDFILAENSKVVYTQVQADAPNAWHLSKSRIQMSEYSRFISTNASAGSKFVRHHYEVHLKGSGAELAMNGLAILKGEEQVHNFIRVHHEAPQCVSNQRFKSIVNDKTRFSFDGTVIVNRGAQLTNSDQLINNLMLSDDAHADSKPNLMIFADDVKCTHGSTVGRLNEEQLFYLNTRGLSQNAAKTLLTRSFAESILDTIQFPAVVQDLRGTILKKLEAKYA